MSGWITVKVTESLHNRVSRSRAESRSEWLSHCVTVWVTGLTLSIANRLTSWVTLNGSNTLTGWHRKIYCTLTEIIPSKNSTPPLFSLGGGGWWWCGVATQPKTHSLNSHSFWEENCQRLWQLWILQTLSMLPFANHFRPSIPHHSTS
jgi:hypothetical protein